MREGKGFLLVYNITSPQTFSDVENLHQYVYSENCRDIYYLRHA